MTQLNSDAEWLEVGLSYSQVFATVPPRPSQRGKPLRGLCVFSWPHVSSDGPSEVWSTRELTTLLVTPVLSLYGRPLCSGIMMLVLVSSVCRVCAFPFVVVLELQGDVSGKVDVAASSDHSWCVTSGMKRLIHVASVVIELGTRVLVWCHTASRMDHDCIHTG